MSEPDETETDWMAYGNCAHRPPSLGVVARRPHCTEGVVHLAQRHRFERR